LLINSLARCFSSNKTSYINFIDHRSFYKGLIEEANMNSTGCYTTFTILLTSWSKSIPSKSINYKYSKLVICFIQYIWNFLHLFSWLNYGCRLPQLRHTKILSTSSNTPREREREILHVCILL
jgi:hypothetical protein